MIDFLPLESNYFYTAQQLSIKTTIMFCLLGKKGQYGIIS